MKNSNKTNGIANFTVDSLSNPVVESFSVTEQNLALKSVAERTVNCLSRSEISFLKVLIGLNIQRV